MDTFNIMGRVLSVTEYAELSDLVLHSWDRLFTGLEARDKISYVFVSRWSAAGGILVVVTREGLIRTMIPMDALDAWLRRHAEMVEVTDRAKRLSL